MRRVRQFALSRDPERAFGGGIDNGGNIKLVNSPVADNTASGSSVAFGGGIYNGGPLTLINSPVMANDASGGEVHGGGIFNSPPAPVVLINSPVTGNIPVKPGAEPATTP
jgi:hypothetical protein